MGEGGKRQWKEERGKEVGFWPISDISFLSKEQAKQYFLMARS